MRKAPWSIAALALALSACGGDNTEEMAAEMADEAAVDATQELALDTVNPVVAANPAASAMTMTAELQPVGGSGVTGQATLTPAAGQTQVMIALNNLAPNSAHAGHIHTGTCASPGPAVQPLQPITANASGTGSMTTTVPLDPNTVMNGQHIVVYHRDAGDSPGSPIVCGALPNHQM